MKYLKICSGEFVDRPNRFIAQVLINGQTEKVHVKNTGRCRELLIPGARVYLEDFEGRMGTRKMRYSLVAVEKNGILINMDSQAPNKAVKEALENGILRLSGMKKLKLVKGEKTYGTSRLDFYVEDEEGEKGFIEVKGVTLEEEGIVRFPDAPTQRGVKHIDELICAGEEGYHAYILFVIQMKGVSCFMPNDAMHREFGDALRRASAQKVKVMAYDCKVTADSMVLDQPVEIKL